LPDNPDGPDYLVLAGGLALAAAWLRFVWLDSGRPA
jgi:hypothetical protein